MKHLEAKALYNSAGHVPVLYRVDYDSSRHYYKVVDNSLVFYDSWTSVIDSMLGYEVGLVKWIASEGYEQSQRYMKERAHYGTVLHILCGEFLSGKELDIEKAVSFHATSYAMTEKLDLDLVRGWFDMLRSDLLAFAQFCFDKEVSPIAIEIPLAHDTLQIAGTIDLVCELKFGQKRVRAIVDMKSGRKGFYTSHKYQLHGYKMTWEENFPDMPIDMLFNWSPKDWSGDTPTYNFTNQTKCDEAKALPHLIAAHRALNEKVEPGYVSVFSGSLKLGSDPASAWSKVELRELLEKRHLVEVESD